jgi:hypothetical protein
MKYLQYFTGGPALVITLFVMLFGVLPPTHAIDRAFIDNLQAAMHTLSFLELWQTKCAFTVCEIPRATVLGRKR